MTRYSVQLRYKRLIKGYGFLSFAERNCNVLKHLILLQKEHFKKHQNQLMILLEIKSLIRLQRSQLVHRRIIQKQ